MWSRRVIVLAPVSLVHFQPVGCSFSLETRLTTANLCELNDRVWSADGGTIKSKQCVDHRAQYRVPVCLRTLMYWGNLVRKSILKFLSWTAFPYQLFIPKSTWMFIHCFFAHVFRYGEDLALTWHMTKNTRCSLSLFNASTFTWDFWWSVTDFFIQYGAYCFHINNNWTFITAMQ